MKILTSLFESLSIVSSTVIVFDIHQIDCTLNYLILFFIYKKMAHKGYCLKGRDISRVYKKNEEQQDAVIYTR